MNPRWPVINTLIHRFPSFQSSGRSRLDQQLARIERLRLPTGQPGFHSTQVHDRSERLLVEPALRPLRTEHRHQQGYLTARDLWREWDEDIRVPEVSFVLRDLVLENRVI